MKETAVVLLTLVGTITALMAAMFWLAASVIVAPSPHIGRLNAIASGAAGVSALCAFALWVVPH